MSNKNLEKLFSQPAIVLEKGIEVFESAEKSVINKKPFKLAEEYWTTLGPGLTTGAADDDPSGIATYSQVGANYGYQLLWLAWFTFPLMAVVQEMCARIGIVTGRGLAANIKHHYSSKVLVATTGLLFAANAFNIGADLGAMAKAVQLIFPTANFILVIIGFAAVSLMLQIFTTYARYAKYLKYLALVLFAYVASALLAGLNWSEVFKHTVIPSIDFSRDQLLIICAVLGTTISPYLFFWQTSQEVEEEKLKGVTQKSWHRHPDKAEVTSVRRDVWTGMFFSNAVMFFIIAACAGTLYVSGVRNINTAADAALALRPIAGDLAFYLFAIGIIGTGMLAIPVLAGSASYAISEAFGWRHGLYQKLKGARAFYGIIIISMILGILFNLLGLDPIKTLIYSAVANAFVSPFILFLIVKMSSDKKIMQEYTNSKAYTYLGWIVTALMAIVCIVTFITLI